MASPPCFPAGVAQFWCTNRLLPVTAHQAFCPICSKTTTINSPLEFTKHFCYAPSVGCELDPSHNPQVKTYIYDVRRVCWACESPNLWLADRCSKCQMKMDSSWYTMWFRNTVDRAGSTMEGEMVAVGWDDMKEILRGMMEERWRMKVKEGGARPCVDV